MSDPVESIHCSSHGKQTATFVCSHLLQGFGNGFFVGFSDEYPDDPFPDAWCRACQEKVEECKGWNDESEAFADIKLICSSCYLSVRLRNQEESERRRFSFGSLENVEETRNQNPRTFSIPRKEERDNLQTGELVKLHFCLKETEEGAPHAERMWVEVEGKTASGTYTGILNNDPYFIADLTEGSKIEFAACNISAVFVGNDSESWVNEDLLASVDKLVIEEEKWPVYASRRIQEDGHCGWLVSSRQIENDEPELLKVELGRLVDLFPVLDSITGEAAGSAWLWDQDSLEYKRV